MGKKRKKMNFKSKKAYLAWLHYGHSTRVFEKTPGDVEVLIKGKRQRVQHTRKRNKKRG